MKRIWLINIIIMDLLVKTLRKLVQILFYQIVLSPLEALSLFYVKVTGASKYVSMLTNYYYFLCCRFIRGGYRSVWWFVD